MKKVLLSILFSGVLISGFAQNDKQFLGQEPGMVSFTYRNSFQKNVAATLDTIKALGITNMEFSNLFGKSAAGLRKLLDERGMRCTSFGVSYGDLVNKTEEVAQNAKTLGATFVRVAWIPHEDAFTMELVKQTVEDFNKAGKILKENHGLEFCYHNHGYEFVPYENGTLFDYLVQQTDPRYVSFEMDILWVVHGGAKPIDLLNKYKERFKLMHLKDLRKGIKGDLSGKTSTNNDVALGSGQIDIKAVLKAAKKAAVKYYYIEDESDNIRTQVPESIAFLRSL